MSTRALRRILIRLLAITLLPASVLVVTTSTAQAANDVGVGVTNLALANVGRTACSVNSLGTQSFDTSCAGNGGQPEHWSADFAEWVWANESIVVNGLTSTPGGSSPSLIWKYGISQGTLHTDPAYRPQVEDVVVYDSPADYVAIVTKINSDGSLQTTGGDWGGQGPGNSVVSNVAIGVSEVSVGSQPAAMAQKTIAGYVTPVRPVGSTPGLVPFGAVTWTPPGGSGSRVDVYAADGGGQLWDYSKASGGLLSSTPVQAGTGFGRYRPVGVVDFNHDGYPDVVVIDNTAPSFNLVAFLGSASGLATVPTVTGSHGWSSNFMPFGVADYQHTGHYGVVAVQKDTGIQYFYPGDLTGGIGSTRVQIDSGWSSVLTPVGVSQFTGDGQSDVFTCRTDTGALMFYPRTNSGALGSPITVLTGCANYTAFGITDYTGDSRPDLILRDNTTGNLILPATGSEQTPTTIGTMIAPSSITKSLVPFGAVTWTPPGGSGSRVDVYAADGGGQLWDYSKASGGLLSSTPVQAGTGFGRYRPVGVVDFNHDGYPDVVVIDNTAPSFNLVAFLGSASGLATVPTVTGSHGWSSNFMPFGVADYQHTGHYGVVAVQKDTGIQYFYPGDLTGGIGSTRVQIDSGWSSVLTPVGVSQFTGDGQSDVFTCRTDTGALMFYPRTNSGALGSPITVLTGCANYTAFGITDYTGDSRPDLILRDNTTGNLITDAGNGGGWWAGNASTTIATGW
jgi:hypothetical protein